MDILKSIFVFLLAVHSHCVEGVEAHESSRNELEPIGDEEYPPEAEDCLEWCYEVPLDYEIGPLEEGDGC